MDQLRREALLARRKELHARAQNESIRSYVRSLTGPVPIPWRMLENELLGDQLEVFTRRDLYPSPHTWIDELWGWEAISSSLAKVTPQADCLTFRSMDLSANEIKAVNQLLGGFTESSIGIIYPLFQVEPFLIRSSDWPSIVQHVDMECFICLLDNEAVIQIDPMCNLNSEYCLQVQQRGR